MTNYELKMPANYAAIVFSAGSSIINNVVTIVVSVKKINSFVPDMGSTKK